ncbi:hypothetical protein ACMBCN_03005 [Candidatus Liberibacter asiaticus]|nr:hypothetical protein [Candidatus Liberibacter asiaticus]
MGRECYPNHWWYFDLGYLLDISSSSSLSSMYVRLYLSMTMNLNMSG